MESWLDEPSLGPEQVERYELRAVAVRRISEKQRQETATVHTVDADELLSALLSGTEETQELVLVTFKRGQ